MEIIEVSSGVINLAKKVKFQHFLLTDKELEEAVAVKNPQILFNSVKTVTRMTKSSDPPMKKKLGKFY